MFQELDNSVIYMYFCLFVYLIQQLTAIAQLRPVFSCIYIFFKCRTFVIVEHFAILAVAFQKIFNKTIIRPK